MAAAEWSAVDVKRGPSRCGSKEEECIQIQPMDSTSRSLSRHSLLLVYHSLRLSFNRLFHPQPFLKMMEQLFYASGVYRIELTVGDTRMVSSLSSDVRGELPQKASQQQKVDEEHS